MKKTPSPEELRREFTALASELAALGWISHGYAQDRGRGAGGPCYQWTRKEKGKTVSVAMSREQYEAMAEAMAAKQPVGRYAPTSLIAHELASLASWCLGAGVDDPC